MMVSTHNYILPRKNSYLCQLKKPRNSYQPSSKVNAQQTDCDIEIAPKGTWRNDLIPSTSRARDVQVEHEASYHIRQQGNYHRL